jgi:autonomous glycyl radical cofactor GrcA
MSTPSSPAQILLQIAQIQSMEFGKLSEYQRPGPTKESGSYFKLQIWQDGKNHTRHVRPEEVPALREAIDGYARFCALTQEYARALVEQTRARLEEGVKKKIQPYSRHCRKKSNDSSNPS